MKALPLLALTLIVAGCSQADAVPESIPKLTAAEKQLGELVLIRKDLDALLKIEQDRQAEAERLKIELLGELPGGKK